jgi:carbon monoxide dehydrogenase subunit G
MANVMATGAVETVGLKISEAGNAQLKSLVAKSAEIEIRGSGSTQLTAEMNADVSISAHPNLSRAEVRGSGRIITSTLADASNINMITVCFLSVRTGLRPTPRDETAGTRC